MKVHCLTKDEKDIIENCYTTKSLNLKELAQMFLVSQRTIGRVLEERGLATPVPRLKGEAHTVLKMMKAAGITVPELGDLLERELVKRQSLNKSGLVYVTR